MKIAVKKVYCPTCQKLVKGREKKVSPERSGLEVSCSACGRPLRLWVGTSWRIPHESD